MIRNFIKFMQEEPNDKMYLRLLFFIFTFLFVVFALLRAFNALGFYFDTHEHIHSSYLISQGLVPYRDFFEHHHPLLWYLLCPLVLGFDRDASVIYAGRLVGIFGYICFLALFYNTVKKYTKNNSTAAQIAVLVLFCFYHIWIDIQTLRPDIFMYVFIFAALSSFFDYLQVHKTKYLCYSYLSWFISFLFLQKALIAGFGFALANIWLLSKKEIKLKDIYAAAFFPLLGGCILLLVLYKIGALHEWWLYNFTFNSFLVSYYNIYSAGVGNLPFIAGILGIIIIRYFRPTDENITIFLCWLSTALQLLQFSPHPQYYFLYLALSILLLSPYLFHLYNKYFSKFILVLILCLWHAFIINYNTYNSQARLHQYISLMDYIARHTRFEDKVQNFPHTFGLFNKDADYYWFGFNNVVIIADLYLNRGFDYNQVIKAHKPKFITLSDNALDNAAAKNSFWLLARNSLLLKKAGKGDRSALNILSDLKLNYWQIDKEYIEKHYNLIQTFNDIELWERVEE